MPKISNHGKHWVLPDEWDWDSRTSPYGWSTRPPAMPLGRDKHHDIEPEDEYVLPDGTFIYGGREMRPFPPSKK